MIKYLPQAKKLAKYFSGGRVGNFFEKCDNAKFRILIHQTYHNIKIEREKPVLNWTNWPKCFCFYENLTTKLLL